ncbi:MAG: RNA polymerase sigma factor (sigma-70 family) [Verrucomicrobiales bacterium]
MNTDFDASFRTTRWTRVLAAKGDSAESKLALSDLCEAYYGPVHSFIRHSPLGRQEDEARDLTHEFFSRILDQPGLESLERGRGKFRSYLLGAVKHFLSDQRKFRQAKKRGGGSEVVSIDGEEGQQLPAAEADSTSDAKFDREWALAVVSRATDQLASDYESAGKNELFETLKPWLNGNAPALSQAEAAGQLGLSEGALKVAIHRLRKRFRESVTGEIRETVETDEEISIELNFLIEALGR